MLAKQIQIIETDQNGEQRIVERVLPTTEFAVKIDGIQYQPAITTNVEIESDGDVTRTKDQCGHTERDRTGDNGWQIRIQGIVTGNDARTNNLSVQLLRDEIANMSELSIRSDVLSGTFEVSNVVISQANDLISIHTDDTEGEEKAFEFQLQLGESDSE